MATSPVRPAAYIRTAVGCEPGRDRAEVIDSAVHLGWPEPVIYADTGPSVPGLVAVISRAGLGTEAGRLCARVEWEVDRIDARLKAGHRAREAGCRVRPAGSHGGQLLALVFAIAQDRYDALLIASCDRVSRRPDGADIKALAVFCRQHGTALQFISGEHLTGTAAAAW
jgi:hypothetical protein